MNNANDALAQRKNFKDISLDIASQFLQSVVVVDDLAYLRETDRPHPRGGLDKPGLGQPKPQRKIVKGADTIDRVENELNAKVLIDTFAEKGLVCSVLRPKVEEEYELKVLKAAERADIVILDWQLQGINSPDIDAAELIGKIITKEKSPDRIRLIVVYSAEKPLKIRDKIENTLNGLSEGCDDYTYTQNATRICLFAKEGTIGVDRSRIVNEEELPDRLISEFAEMTMGLLSNAALASMATLRKNTHRILGKFHPKLDAPYLSHRALMKPSEEAESHIVPLIVSEVQSVLEDQEISKFLTIDNISEWIDYHRNYKPTLPRRMHIGSFKVAKELLIDIIGNGIHKETKSKAYPNWNKLIRRLKEETSGGSISELTDILSIDGASGSKFDREFAYLMSICSHYDNPPPILNLGTIVALGSDTKAQYYLCVQPVCDSVRISGKRPFPFLRMIKASNSEANDFGFIVRENNDDMIELRLSLRPHEVQMFEFKPILKDKCIYAHKQGNAWVFKTTDGDAKLLRWIGDLRPSHSQRVANDYAREISRVGLIESEWLRRQATKKKV